jgi:hypothetical protein
LASLASPLILADQLHHLRPVQPATAVATQHLSTTACLASSFPSFTLIFLDCKQQLKLIKNKIENVLSVETNFFCGVEIFSAVEIVLFDFLKSRLFNQDCQYFQDLLILSNICRDVLTFCKLFEALHHQKPRQIDKSWSIPLRLEGGVKAELRFLNLD